jgi:predicted  nucleic acid-binding Zn-ribbon protein
MIARDYPRRFGSRIRQLREQHQDIGRALSSLRTRLESMQKDMIDVADLRERLGALVDAIRRRRERETDLVYEAVRLDLGRADHERAQPFD